MELTPESVDRLFLQPTLETLDSVTLSGAQAFTAFVAVVRCHDPELEPLLRAKELCSKLELGAEFASLQGQIQDSDYLESAQKLNQAARADANGLQLGSGAATPKPNVVSDKTAQAKPKPLRPNYHVKCEHGGQKQTCAKCIEAALGSDCPPEETFASLTDPSFSCPCCVAKRLLRPASNALVSFHERGWFLSLLPQLLLLDSCPQKTAPLMTCPSVAERVSPRMSFCKHPTPSMSACFAWQIIGTMRGKISACEISASLICACSCLRREKFPRSGSACWCFTASSLRRSCALME